MTGPDPAHSFWAGPDLSSPVNSGEWINSLSTIHTAAWTVEEEEEGRGADLRCCWRLLTGEWLGRRSAFFFFSVFFSALFFLSFPVLFLLPLSGHSSVSVVATVVAHGGGGDGCGRMLLHMVVPVGGFASFLLCFCFSSVCLCFCFFFYFSRCKGYYQWRGGRWQLAVAMVAAMRTAADGSSSFLSFFVFTSKTWQWRWWYCCCSSCLCRGVGFFFFFTGVAAGGGRCWEAEEEWQWHWQCWWRWWGRMAAVPSREKNDGHQRVFFPCFKTNSSLFSNLIRLPPFSIPLCVFF